LSCWFDYSHCGEGRVHACQMGVRVVGIGVVPCNWVEEAAGVESGGCHTTVSQAVTGGRLHAVCMCVWFAALAVA
jgi:hypothetical protein